MLQTHNKKKFSCQTCGKCFATKNGLANHQKVYSGTYTHMCPHCGQGFVYKSALDTHVPGHTGEKTLKCKGCPKAYVNSSSLERHSRYCGKPVERITCATCGTKLKTKEGLAEHMAIHNTDMRPHIFMEASVA